jgi:hypothetical protein
MTRTVNPSAPSTFSFINDDVTKQVNSAKSILEIADKLRELLPRVTDEKARAEFAGHIHDLVLIANSLSVNAMTTSSTASTAVSGVIFWPKK